MKMLQFKIADSESELWVNPDRIDAVRTVRSDYNNCSALWLSNGETWIVEGTPRGIAKRVEVETS